MEEVVLTQEEFETLLNHFRACMMVWSDEEQITLTLQEGPILEMLEAIAARHNLPSKNA